MTPPIFKLYGVFGFPLQHTLSPVMQEAAFRTLGLKAFYLPWEVSREEFRRLMRRRRDLVLEGFNVTVPYKGIAWEELRPNLTPEAREMRAVNTVFRKGGKWFGANTDARGFLISLREEGKFNPRGKKVLVLGAGGAARAVVYGLAKSGASRIVIVNRTRLRAKKMIFEFARFFPKVEFGDASLRGDARSPQSNDVELVVNATAVGLKSGDPVLVSPACFPKKTLFIDLIYNPAETRLLRLARQSGHRTLNGLGMLVHQGAEAFRWWTGRRPPVKVMREAVLTVTSKRGR